MRTLPRQLPRGRRSKYPWEEWMDGEVHTAKAEVDFTCSIPSFVTGVHIKAKTNGMRAETSTSGDVVSFVFIKEEEKDNAEAVS